VFIIVCRDTKLAKWSMVDHGRGEGAAPPIEEFGNRNGKEYTVRVDSRVIEEISSGIAKSDESRRLRFVLSTIGKPAWPGEKIPEEYLELVEKMNRKATQEGGQRIDPRLPPGRDVRCIVSVAMLTEGWDATTVTHIVGLRPFESQLLCEQVVGRGLRRSQYHDLTVEEVAKVYGVPFELIPLKATPGGTAPPPAKVHHVYALSPTLDHLEIRFPRVEGYTFRLKGRVRVAWAGANASLITNIPRVKMKGSPQEGGRLSLMGPGKTDEVTLQPGRDETYSGLDFELARAPHRRCQSPTCEIPTTPCFRVLTAVVSSQTKVSRGRADRKCLLNPYFSWSVETMAGHCPR
jgi:type III restriction enzyme